MINEQDFLGLLSEVLAFNSQFVALSREEAAAEQEADDEERDLRDLKAAINTAQEKVVRLIQTDASDELLIDAGHELMALRDKLPVYESSWRKAWYAFNLVQKATAKVAAQREEALRKLRSTV
jgi:hypothetical protein